MLRLMLHAHPNIAIPPQTTFLKKLYKRRLLFGDMRKDSNRQKIADWYSSHFNRDTKLSDLGIELQELVNDTVQAPGSFGSVMAVPFQAYSRRFNKPRWGDKRPYYIHHLPVLRALFPHSQIIHIIRDGRDCIASLKRMPWWRKDLTDSIINCKSAIRHGQQSLRTLPPEDYMEIRYEDLVRDPGTGLQTICRFLGEEYTDQMLDFPSVAKYAVPEYKLDWHAATHQKANHSSEGRWKQELSDIEIAMIQAFAGNELTHHGYSLAESRLKISHPHRLRFQLRSCNYYLRRTTIRTTDSLMSLLYQWPLSWQSTGQE